MTPPVVAAFYAGLSALLLAALAVRVIRRRAALRVAWGDGGDAALMRAVRAHGNAAETIPLMLILLALIEMFGAPGWVAHLFGLAILGGRLLHAWSCAGEGRGWARIAGMALTFAVLGLGGAGLAAHAALRMLTP
jgi:uncharacterized membrane protein YecN with MAPEG domain